MSQSTAAQLEHANLTVSDPIATAAWMNKVFGWHIRWQGSSLDNGYSVHVGSNHSYVALYSPDRSLEAPLARYKNKGTLNHLAVVVQDFDATERAVKAAGFTPQNHADYEPGRRFYFLDDQGVEYEVVQYD